MVIVQLTMAVLVVAFVYGDTRIFLEKALAPEEDDESMVSFHVPLLSPAV